MNFDVWYARNPTFLETEAKALKSVEDLKAKYALLKKGLKQTGWTMCSLRCKAKTGAPTGKQGR